MKTLYTLENLPEFWERSLPMDNAFVFAITTGIIAFVIGFLKGSEWFINHSKDYKLLVNENINLIDEIFQLKQENEIMQNEINISIKNLKNE